MRKTILAVLVLTTVVFSAAPARAGGGVYSGTSGYEFLEKGLWDIGLDSLFLLRYFSVPDDGNGASSSTLKLTCLAGLTPKYFIIRNLSVGASLNFFYERTDLTTEAGGVESSSTSSDTGFMGFAMANYHLRLGHSLFFKPGIGAGYFYGTRSVPTGTPGLKAETTLSGFTGRVDLGFVYYASAHFNLKAGIDVLIRFGSEKPDGGGDGQDFTSVDAGFGVGLGYSF